MQKKSRKFPHYQKKEPATVEKQMKNLVTFKIVADFRCELQRRFELITNYFDNQWICLRNLLKEKTV